MRKPLSMKKPQTAIPATKSMPQMWVSTTINAAMNRNQPNIQQPRSSLHSGPDLRAKAASNAKIGMKTPEFQVISE